MADLIISSKAESDLTEIFRYVADEDITAALRLEQRILGVFDLLAQSPYAGRERSDLNEGLRSFPVGIFLVFYRIWAGKVAITRVLHSARDLNELSS